jgi:WD40 repeat protein/transcriptional regulator with XRE-family HTH domain
MPSSIPENTLEKFTTFGDLLRFLRRRAGITQLELSIAVGYSDAQISRLEQNLRPPDIPTIEARFVSALGLEEEPKAVARLLDLAANVRREDAPGLGLCPYKGLNCFEEADADLFVGREELTAKLVDRIFPLISKQSPNQARFLAIVGASGSGKSSLVQAGLIPALRWNQKSIDWQIHILTPTAHPLESLAASLTDEKQSVSAVTTLMDDLARDPRSLQVFVKRKLGARDRSHLLLVVDQFEELFALCRSEEERAAFIACLLSAASEVDGPVIVLITLRADFYAHCADYLQLREALATNQEYIGAMTEEELRRAIEEPARRGRWEFETGLVDLLLHDIGREPGALPLLSHALLETWQRRRGRAMTLSGYTSSGGVRGAIAETAESVFADQFSQSQQETARRIFLRLTELGDETATGDTRRRATFNELILNSEETNTTHALLKVLADARLIVTSEETVEVSHEALIREWPRLRGWLEDNREGLRLHRQLTEAAQEWESLHREPDLLYRGARLTQAQEWAVIHREEMNGLEREFLDASIAFVQQEALERESQRQRELESARRLAESEKQRAEEQAQSAAQLSQRARYLTGAFILALLMAFTALYFGSQARETAITAQTDRRIANARELAAASLNNLSVDPERSILLAQQSIATTRSVDGTVLPESFEALHRAIVASPIRMTLDNHGTRVLSVDYSPDGKQFATIGDDGTVILWETQTGKELLRLSGATTPGDLVTSQRIDYSTDGKRLAACDRDQVKIYDPVTGALLQTLTGYQTDVSALAFRRDGTQIASGDIRGGVVIWDTASGDSLMELTGHTAEIEGLTFTPDGKYLITTSADATMKIWDVVTGDILRDFTDFTGLVDTVAFSLDGTRFAFTSEDGLRVFSFDVADDIVTLTDHEIFALPGGASVTFSPDGMQLAAASGSATAGNSIKVWDAATGQELLTLAGHTSWVMGIGFSPDGKSLASTSLDGTVKVWSLSPGKETVTVMSPPAVYGIRVAYSPNGQAFATNAGDGTARIWNAETGEAQLALAGHTLETMSVAFSPDGMHFATGSLDGTAIVWDTTTGKELLTLSGHADGVRDITFGPDGKLLGTGGFDGTAKIWDVNSGKLIHEITGHEGIVLGVAFSPDGKQFATSSTDATAKIWDVGTGELLFTLAAHQGGLPDIAYSPDGTLIVTGSGDGIAILWDSATGSQLRTLIGHSSQIQSVAFSPDGKFLATGSEDNTAKVWDVQTGREILTLPGSVGAVRGIVFSPSDDGAHLVVSSGDGIARVFLLRIEDLLTLAQARVTRSLTMAECQEYLHVEQCPVEP